MSTEVAADAISYEPRRDEKNVTAAAIGIVGLKLLGVYLFFTAVAALPQVYQFATATSTFPGGNGRDYLAPAIASVSIYLIASLTLIFAGRPVAALLFGKTIIEPDEVGPMAWMTIIVAGVGLALMVFSINEAVSDLTYLFERVAANSNLRSLSPMSGRDIVTLVLPLARLAIGGALFLRPRWIVGRWIRHVQL